MRKIRLIAGTINAWPDDDEWRNVTLDLSDRGIYDREVEMLVKPDFVTPIGLLADFRDEMIDEVRCHHVLEHMTLAEGRLAIRAFFRVLKPGGVLDVEVPDMDRIAQAWVDRRFDPGRDLQQWIYGEVLSEHEIQDSHRSAWNEDLMREALTDVGFEVGARESTDLALNYRAVKPA